MRSLPPIESLVTCDGQPPPKSPYIPVVRAQVGGVVRGVLLNDTVRGVVVHNVDDRDTPCCGDECQYVWRGKHRSCRRKYYLACCHPEYKKRFTLELTSEAWRLYWVDRDKLVAPARGIVAATWRIGTAKTSPARVHFDHPAKGVGELPEGFDPLEAMYELWGRDTVALALPDKREIPQ